MALNPIPVADSVAALIQATAPAPGTPITADMLQTMWRGIMTLIYNDIIANAEVIVTVTSVSGVSTGGGSSGPGTGTGEVT